MKGLGKKLKRQEGQSAIEFIIVVLVVFFFLFFYLSLAMVLVISQYMDYATFMAARTFKAAYGSINDQQRNAQEVFNTYASRVTGNGLIRSAPQIEFFEAEPGNPATAGARSTYELDLFYLPPLFVQGRTIPSRIVLTSEAALGREPNNDECFGFFNTLSQRLGLGIEGSGFIDQMDDNGC